MASAAPERSSQPSARLRRLLQAREVELKRVVLNVNAQVVYRADDSTSPFTLYVLKIRDAGAPDSRRAADEWQLQTRYSQCATFHGRLGRLVAAWEAARLQEAPDEAANRARVLLRTLKTAVRRQLPRKHMRYDTQEIIRERQRRLPDFVHVLFTAYTDLMLYFHFVGQQQQESPTHGLLRRIFGEIEAFLCVPDKRKEADARMVAAILALDDASQQTAAGGDEDCGGLTDEEESMCCICLGEHCDVDNSSHGSEEGPEADDGERWVALPCAHQFHEACVISWFRAKASCPVCRRDAGAAATMRS